jgi:hypothetical protein
VRYSFEYDEHHVRQMISLLKLKDHRTKLKIWVRSEKLKNDIILKIL